MLNNFSVKKDSKSFNKRKSGLLSVFHKTMDGLSSLIIEQQLYRDNLIDEQVKIQAEIELTESSIDESKRTITKIENILN